MKGLARATEARAESLVGRMIYLHQAKAQPPNVGGRIESYREVQTDLAHSRWVIFTSTSRLPTDRFSAEE